MRLVSLPAAQGPVLVNPEAVAMLVPDGEMVWLHLIGVSDKSWPIYMPMHKVADVLQTGDPCVRESEQPSSANPG